MSTRSIFRDVRIKNRELGRGLVSALENAEGKHGKKVTISKKCSELKGEAIKNIFGDKDE